MEDAQVVRAKGDRALGDWLDRFAITASMACLVHCIGLPLLLALAPSLAAAAWVPEKFHLWLVLAALPVSLLSLGSGWRVWRRPTPLLLGSTGLLLLSIAVVAFGGTAADAPLTMMGSIALSCAHILNWRQRHDG
jgi:hypothetical protein